MSHIMHALVLFVLRIFSSPIINLSFCFLQGEPEPFIRNVFTLNTCGAIVGSDVIACETENELLEKWADFIRKCDPDIITGYNINNFDLPYLLNRYE